MNEHEDPIRWTESGAQKWQLALLAELREPPPLPPAVRRRVRRAVTAEVQPGPALPWRALLLAAAVALLAFTAGWLWAGRETPPPEQPLAAPAAPIEPERREPEAEEPRRPMEARSADVASPAEEPRRREPWQTPEPTDPVAERSTRAPRRSAAMAPTMAPESEPLAPTRAESPMALTMEPDRGQVRDPSAATEEGKGMLVINTIPWARVFVDGWDTGQNTPVRNLRVSAGEHRIGLRTVDGTMHMVTVTVRAGEVMRLMRRL